MSTRSRWTFAAVGCVVVVVGAVAAAQLASDDDRPAAGATPSVPEVSATATVDPAPTATTSPTSLPVAPTSAAPEPTVSSVPPAPTAEPSVVGVVTTFSGFNASTRAVEVGGYAEVVESGGQCLLRLTRGSTVVEQTADALNDASTTSCGAVSVAATRLTPGTWTGVLVYSSATTRGESSPVTIEVP